MLERAAVLEALLGICKVDVEAGAASPQVKVLGGEAEEQTVDSWHEEAETWLVDPVRGSGAVDIRYGEADALVIGGEVLLYQSAKVCFLPAQRLVYLALLRPHGGEARISIGFVAEEKLCIPMEANERFSFVVVLLKEETLRDDLSGRYPDLPAPQTKVLASLAQQAQKPALRGLLEQIETFGASGAARRRFFQNKLKALRFYLSSAGGQTCGACGVQCGCLSEDDIGLCTVASYLRDHLAESPSVQVLSRMAGMSPTKLKTLFKKRYGDTLYGHLRALRMARAAELLSSGGTVSETAYTVGYQSVNRFSEAFVAAYGVLPGAYKAQRAQK